MQQTPHQDDRNLPRAPAPTWSWRRIVAAQLSMLLAGLSLWLMLVQPRNDRAWVELQGRTPRFSQDRDAMTVINVRDATYASDGFVTDVGYHTRTVHLSKLRGADLLISHFSDVHGVAHAFLSFNFGEDGRLAVSVEARREVGEEYSPFLGLVRQYELVVVVGTERDLIGKRTNVEREAVYAYPLRLSPEALQTLFVGLSTRAERLATTPVFYNSITDNCMSDAMDLLADATGLRLPWYAGVLPGYVDEVAYERGLLDTSVPFDELQRGALLRHDVLLEDPRFSERVRSTDST